MRLLMTSLACVGAAAGLALVGSALLYHASMGAAIPQPWLANAGSAQDSAPAAISSVPPYFGHEYAAQHRSLASLPDEPAAAAAPTF